MVSSTAQAEQILDGNIRHSANMWRTDDANKLSEAMELEYVWQTDSAIFMHGTQNDRSFGVQVIWKQVHAERNVQMEVSFGENEEGTLIQWTWMDRVLVDVLSCPL